MPLSKRFPATGCADSSPKRLTSPPGRSKSSCAFLPSGPVKVVSRPAGSSATSPVRQLVKNCATSRWPPSFTSPSRQFSAGPFLSIQRPSPSRAGITCRALPRLAAAVLRWRRRYALVPRQRLQKRVERISASSPTARTLTLRSPVVGRPVIGWTVPRSTSKTKGAGASAMRSRKPVSRSSGTPRRGNPAMLAFVTAPGRTVGGGSWWLDVCSSPSLAKKATAATTTAATATASAIQSRVTVVPLTP